jgi:hypothetical protein
LPFPAWSASIVHEPAAATCSLPLTIVHTLVVVLE